jgi:large subunit ribosomal protein L3
VVLGLIGKKLGITQIFSRDGQMVPVTVIQAGPCCVVQKKTREKDGYTALQIGFGDKKMKKVTKPVQGHCKAAGGRAFAILQELRIDNTDAYEVGQDLTLSIFKVGDKVKVSGISKGKGFAGVMKRHNFKGGAESHGSMFHRAPGSIGASADPSRVLKGMRGPGHMGSAKVTMKNLEIVEIREKENLLLLKGSVPGARNSLITLYQQQKSA